VATGISGGVRAAFVLYSAVIAVGIVAALVAGLTG
jgi:hypothetical protein